MAYKFVDRTPHTQEEMAYILYKTIGAYFHKTSCSNKLQETRLFLHYNEMADAKRKKMEAQIDQAVEKAAAKHREKFAALNCKVTITRRDKTYELWFATGFEEIFVRIAPDCSVRMTTYLIEENRDVLI